VDAKHFYLPAVVAGSGPVLREAADAHRAALLPAAKSDRHAVIAGMRSACRTTDETPIEAKATMDMLVAHLADVPLDILRDGCRAFVNAPGKVFFPKAAGELRVFINPMIERRARRARNLQRMADAADEADREAARLAAVEEIPMDEINGWPLATRRGALERGWITQAQFDAATLVVGEGE
jgi:hypothetical protein